MSFLIAKYSKHNKHSCININHYFNDYGIILQGRTHIISSKFCYRVTGNKHITSLLLIISIVILHQICLFCSKLLKQKRSSCANNFTPIYCPRIQRFQNKAELDFFFPKIWRKVFTIFFQMLNQILHLLLKESLYLFYKETFLPHLTINRFQLLQCGQHKHSCLSHTRLGLTKDIHGQNSLRNALVLD